MSAPAPLPLGFDRHRDARRITPCRARATDRGHTDPA